MLVARHCTTLYGLPAWYVDTGQHAMVRFVESVSFDNAFSNRMGVPGESAVICVSREEKAYGESLTRSAANSRLNSSSAPTTVKD
mmetsp:Transcript_87742/g.247577  ORF Transcript_87742/g.247577 Transcript_87742/m.247577 type:complete len:85 (+) Transcript_87742:1659-1913(+)